MANFTKYFISNRCFNTINGRHIQSQFMLVTALYYFHEMINPVTLPSISENDPLKTNQDFENDPAANWAAPPHDQPKKDTCFCLVTLVAQAAQAQYESFILEVSYCLILK